MTARELYERASVAVQQARAILDEYDGKEMPQDKQNEVDQLMDEAEAKSEQAQRLERLSKNEAQVNRPVNRLETPEDLSAPEGDATKAASELQMQVFRKALLHGPQRLNEVESKNLVAQDDVHGGYLTAPQQMVDALLKFLDDMVYVRQVAEVYQVNGAASLGVVSLDSDPADPVWTSETGDISWDTTMDFGKRELTPYYLGRGVKISRQLMRNSTRPVERIVQDRLGYKFGVVQENNFLQGDGDKKPLGMFTASDNGITTARDVVAASATALQGDDFVNMYYSIKPQYMMSQRARWIMHRDVLKLLRKAKTSDGQYLWQPGLQTTNPRTILDVPYVVSEYAPNTVTTGEYVAVLGDMAFYWIAESMQLQIQVFIEKFGPKFTAYAAETAVDGMPVLSEAFARLKMG
jgi:HK97 family phage major capsid protein